MSEHWQTLESNLRSRIDGCRMHRRKGKLKAVHGMVLEATGLEATLGELADVYSSQDKKIVTAEVVGLRDERTLLMPHGPVEGLSLSGYIVARGEAFRVPVGDGLLGRVLDARCEPLDDLGPVSPDEYSPLISTPINPLHRDPIDHQLNTGVTAVDLFTPLGRGQRVGIFAGSGVGKSTLLGMMSKGTNADVVVIALIGERGREVGDFIRDSLGTEGLRNAVVIAAAAEQPAVLRRQAAYTATTVAEWFRATGKHVLLIMDSVTRFALAQREIGLATGEPMGSRGYPPSVFSLLPPLMERAGLLRGEGSITGVYTVLVEGDDLNEPVSDNMRAILDGHIVLDRYIASKGRWPAVDLLNSISRLAGALRSPAEKQAIDTLLAALGQYADSEDLINLGAYEKGSNGVLDIMMELKPKLDQLITQYPKDKIALDDCWQNIFRIADRVGQVVNARAA